MIENKCKNCEYYRNPDYTRCHECKIERNKVGPDEYTKYGIWIGEKDDSCDLISRKDAIKAIEEKAKSIKNEDTLNGLAGAAAILFDLLSVIPGHCKDCKYFEYDYMANIDGIPLIVAHEFCKRWGDGCKTKEDGYCFLYEPSESEE